MSVAPAKVQMSPGPPESLVIHFLTLRRIIGILGVALPFVVWIGARLLFNTTMLESISAYYYTPMRDVFVGILCAIGVFLFSYRGYGRRDDVAGYVASLFGIGVALFPTAPAGKSLDVFGMIHSACAVLFFSTLTYFSLFLFTKTNPDEIPSRRKRQRNIIYRICGGLMAASLLLMLIHAFLPKDLNESIKGYCVRFWLETVVIVAFGVSWLTKGQAILWDRK